jgi:phenylacetic acid degradation operon negative regulatory protein
MVRSAGEFRGHSRILTNAKNMTETSDHARESDARPVPMKPRAIVWDLFGDHLRYVGDGQVPMRALTLLLGEFGVAETTARVVLSRMRREGWFTTSRDGRQTSYALTARSIKMLDEGRARIFDRGRDRTWRMVIYAVPEESRAERDRVRRTLTWHGFGPLAAATWISPHPRLETVREALADLSATRIDLLESRALSRAADREMAFRCWDLDGLGRDYRTGRRLRAAAVRSRTRRAARPRGAAAAGGAGRLVPGPAVP